MELNSQPPVLVAVASGHVLDVGARPPDPLRVKLTRTLFATKGVEVAAGCDADEEGDRLVIHTSMANVTGFPAVTAFAWACCVTVRQNVYPDAATVAVASLEDDVPACEVVPVPAARAVDDWAAERDVFAAVVGPAGLDAAPLDAAPLDVAAPDVAAPDAAALDEAGAGEADVAEAVGLGDAAGAADAGGLAVAEGVAEADGLALAVTGATARVSSMPWVPASPRRTGPCRPAAVVVAVLAALVEADGVAVGSWEHATTAGESPVIRELGISMLVTANAATEIPAKTLAAGAPAVRILTPRARTCSPLPCPCRLGAGCSPSLSLR